MPHVSANLSFLKGCMRKLPFESKEAAESLNPEDFRVYFCRCCDKWHRTSKPHLKQRLLERKLRGKAKARIKALRKRSLMRQYDN